ncbi:hypothetical protein MTP99_015310 [Tenebrio molitor]|jgi:hypothetical protein|nr:hypothetical protein MTP99_015310 [Tenebrio molitor]
MHYRNANESLESQLKESIKVNPLCKDQNLRRTLSTQESPLKLDLRRNKNTSSKPVKTSQSLHKGRAVQSLVKYPLENIPLGLEQKKKLKPIDKKKKSTLEFIEQLKKIETTSAKTDFLEKTNEELEIASKQLDELQKLIADRLQRDSNSSSQSKFVLDEDEETMHQRKRAVVDKFQKQFDRMQKKYLNKTRIRYKSLQDFENATHSRLGRSGQLEKIVEENVPVEVLFSKPKNSAMSRENVVSEGGQSHWREIRGGVDSALKKHISSLTSEEPVPRVDRSVSPRQGKMESAKGEEIHTDERVAAEIRRQKVRFQNEQKSPEKSTYYFSPRGKALQAFLDEEEFSESHVEKLRRQLFPHEDKEKRVKSMQDECCQAGGRSLPQKTSLSWANKEKALPRSRFQNDKLNQSILRSNYFFSSDDVDMFEEEENSEGMRKLNLLLHGEEKVLDGTQTEDAKLEESVLKSEYLSKEFSIDFKKGFSKENEDKAVRQRNMQLLQSVVHKYQDRQPCKLANLTTGREGKLYSKLNTALKDTLFTEIQK